MAEVINEMQERLLGEYELMKKFDICTNEQLRDVMKKRQSLQSKITLSNKQIRDYADFIIFEKKVHKWIKEKEKTHGTGLNTLKSCVVQRIISLYREGLRLFPHEERFWENFIQFSKKSVPQEVLGIYENWLTFHGNVPSIWCDAALWAYEYSMKIDKVKEIFFRALQRHPESEIINRTFFDILLMEASKMSAEKNLENNTFSEQDLGMQRVEMVYRNSRKQITTLTYYISLLERCEEENFKTITAPLQKHILQDLMNCFGDKEELWDVLAQRELKGFNFSDLKQLHKRIKREDEVVIKPEKIEENNHYNDYMRRLENAVEDSDTLLQDENPDKLEGDGEDMDVVIIDDKNSLKPIKEVFKRRTLKRRIELCVKTYQAAVGVFKNNKMWDYYISAMLRLNEDMSTQRVFKRKQLAFAFKTGHQAKLLDVDHYLIFMRLMMASPNGLQPADEVLSEAIEIHPKASKLYETWMKIHIGEDNEEKVMEIFRKAIEKLDTPDTFPLWRLAINFYKSFVDDQKEKLDKLYSEASEKIDPSFGVFRIEYLEFYALRYDDMEQARALYNKLYQLPPPNLNLHKAMAELETNLIGAINDCKTCGERWRLCFERATLHFGKTDTSIWLDYINHEKKYGNMKLITGLYNRAKSTLNDELVEKFVSEYMLMMTML